MVLALELRSPGRVLRAWMRIMSVLRDLGLRVDCLITQTLLGLSCNLSGLPGALRIKPEFTSGSQFPGALWSCSSFLRLRTEQCPQTRLPDAVLSDVTIAKVLSIAEQLPLTKVSGVH